MRDSIVGKYEEEIRKNLELVNQKSLEIDQLERQMQEASAAQEEAENNLETMVNNSGGVISQYQRLAQILQAYRDEDMRSAILLYLDTDFTVLNDGILDSIAAGVQQDMAANGFQILEQMGDEAMARPDVAQAIDYYEKSLVIKPDNAAVIYKIGLAYKGQGNVDAANQYFGDVIMNYPNSEYVEQAKEQRGY